MRILHLTTFLQGGAGRIIAALALAQHGAGHQVRVVTSRTGTSGYGNYDAHIDDLSAAGVAVYQADSMFSRDVAQNLDVVRVLHEVFPRGAEPDVIHCHAATPSLVGLLFAGSRRSDTAIVQTMHGWGLSKTPDQASADIGLMNLVDRIAVPSHHGASLVASLGVRGSALEVIPYGVRDADSRGVFEGRDIWLTRRIVEARRRGALVVACIGTFGARKNQVLLIDAIARLSPSTRLLAVFIGDGDASQLVARAEKLRVAESCVIHGYSPDARHLAAMAGVLVLPSLSEGQPIAILEAFADRVLVAASAIPELVELVDDGVTGVGFASGNAVSLAEGLRRIAEMAPAERDAICVRAEARYQRQFKEDVMVRRYEDLYLRARSVRSEAKPDASVCRHEWTAS